MPTRFGYDLLDRTSEVDAGGNVLRRYAFDPDGSDAPLVWYEGSGTADRRWLHADERGSIVAVTDAGGNPMATNRYDEYGVPAATNLGRFGYTGQAWLPEAGLWYYKARMYAPALGRFLQTDPIGYDAGLNLYNYVGGDPVNATDPSGLVQTATCPSYSFQVSYDSSIDTVYCQPFSSGGGTGDIYVVGRRLPGGGPSGAANSVGTTVPRSAVPQNGQPTRCVGTVRFSAIGPNQAPGNSALYLDQKPWNGSVAIGGAKTFGASGKPAIRPYGKDIQIYFGADMAKLLADTGGPAGPYNVSDYGDANIRNSSVTRFDIYRFSTDKGAAQFGVRNFGVTVTLPAGSGLTCPAGTTAQ